MIKIVFFYLSWYVPLFISLLFVFLFIYKISKKQIVARFVSRRLFYIALIWLILTTATVVVHTELWFQYIKYSERFGADTIMPPISSIVIEIISVGVLSFSGSLLLKWAIYRKDR